MITIVGGGPAGLACGLALQRAGRAFRLIEAESRFGGRVQSERREGWLIEKGPAAVLDNVEATHQIVKELDLAAEVVRGSDAVKRRYLAHGGALVPVPSAPPGLLGTPLLSLGGKLRLLGDLFVRAGARPDESMASFFRRHLGAEATEVLVDAMQSGIFAGDIEQLSLQACFPLLAELEAKHGSLLRGALASASAMRGRAKTTLLSLRGGLRRIIDGLEQRLAPSIVAGERFTALPDQAGAIVLALPAVAAAELLRSIEPPLASLLDQTRMVPMAAVTLGYARAQVTHPLDGFGFLVPRREPLPGGRILGAIFMSSIFPDNGYAPAGHVALRVLMGGAHAPEVETMTDDELRTRALSAIEPLVGASGSPAFVDVSRWRRGIDQYAVGHLDRLAEIERRGAAHRLHFIGSSYRGPGLNDALRQGWELGQKLAAEST